MSFRGCAHKILIVQTTKQGLYPQQFILILLVFPLPVYITYVIRIIPLVEFPLPIHTDDGCHFPYMYQFISIDIIMYADYTDFCRMLYRKREGAWSNLSREVRHIRRKGAWFCGML